MRTEDPASRGRPPSDILESSAPESVERRAAVRRGRQRASAAAHGEGEPRDPHTGTAAPEVAHRAFSALADNVRDYAIFLMDTEGIITFWGEGARLIKGWSRDEAEGAHLRLLYPDGGGEDGTAEEHLRTAAETGEYVGEGHRLRADGSTFWGGISLTALRDADGTLLGFAKVTRDLTAQRVAEVEQMTARQALEETSRLKSALLAAAERAHQETERHVAERTAELARANERLTAEMAERTHLESARNDLLRRLTAVEEQERLRLSRELHDQMGQLVTALRLGLRSLESGPGTASSSLGDLERLTEEIAREIHQIAGALRPPALDRLGLRQALRAHLEEWSARYGIAADFQCVAIDGERFEPAIETTIFRAAQEGLTNVVRHAGATAVSLVLERRRGSIGMILEDDGQGFDVAAATVEAARTGRVGLLGMRERVALLGGTLLIESSPGSGTTLFARLPVSVPADTPPHGELPS